MSGILTNGLAVATVPLTGIELLPADTQLTAGALPESESVSTAQLAAFAGSAATPTTDSGATQTLTTAMIISALGQKMFHTSSGGTTATLTTPTAAQIIAALAPAGGWNANNNAGSSYILRLSNNNSGTNTLAGGTGVTITGTATQATATWREYLVQVTSATTVSFTNVGAGTI